VAVAPFGADAPRGAALPVMEDPLGRDSLGEEPLEEEPLEEDSLGEEPLAEGPLGEDSLGEEPLGAELVST
jgi:hypothetical protein